MADETKTLMGLDYYMRVDFTIDDWTWLCHTLRDTQKRLLETCGDCEECVIDVTEVLAVIEAGEAVAA